MPPSPPVTETAPDVIRERRPRPPLSFPAWLLRWRPCHEGHRHVAGRACPCASPVMRGLAGRCPRCGKGKLFDGFLTLRPRCEACGLDYSFVDSGDGPAFFVMLFAGFIVVGSALVVEVLYQPPFWVHAVLWLPLILLTTLGAAAADEGPADRAAVSSQGRRRPVRRRRRAVAHGVGGAPAAAIRLGAAASVCAGRACDLHRPRHLAARAQGLEGSADCHARAAPGGEPAELPPRGRWPSLDRIR